MSDHFLLAACAALMTGLLAAAPANAAATARTFVSGKGLDTNPCTITAPCRSFQQAVNQTAAGGEVVALDPGGYGVVTIGQSISLVNDGVGTVSISVPANGTGIIIGAGPSDSVHLRGIEIDGNNSGNNTGIVVNSAGSVELLNCVVRHTMNAVYFQASNLVAAIRDSTLSDNANAGLYVKGTGVNVALDGDQLAADLYGVDTEVSDNASTVNIRDCVISGLPYNGGHVIPSDDGVLANGGRVFISDSQITSFYYGVYAGAKGIVAVDSSTLTENAAGLGNTDGGIVFTYNNNAINYNIQTDENGTITHYAPE